MRCASLLILFLLTCCSSPKLRTLQVDYLENGQQKTIFLNVKETNPYQFEVLSQEWTKDSVSFIIQDIFDYELSSF